MRDRFGADDSAAAAAIVDDDGLAERLGHALRIHAPENVVGAARRGGHDDANGFSRVVLGVRGCA